MKTRFIYRSFWALSLCWAALLVFPQSASSNPAVYEVGDDPAVGFNLVSWWNFGGSGNSTWQNAVQSIYDAGFRSVSISPLRYLDIDTGAVLSSSPRSPDLSHIDAAVVRAKSLGMRVTLNPFVELFDANGAGTGDDEYFADLPGGCTWRGCWNPTAGSGVANQFWGDYQNYLVAVAQIAQTRQVDAMTIGTELKALNGNSGHNAKWDSAIDAAAAVYEGPLGYAANWDDYRNGNLTSAVWEHPEIDFMGIDSYFQNLVTTAQADASGTFPNPTFIDQVTTAWNNKLDFDLPTDSLDGIMLFAGARKGGQGMPVAFTEVGYLPFNRTTRTPQNESGAPDDDEQTMAFNGLMNALDGRGEEFQFVDVWQWGMPGTDGSLWNMDTTLPVNQPNNLMASQWLASFVGTAVLPLAGDYNRDGQVDAADYVAWRKTSGQYVLQHSGADGDGNGVVDSGDYGVWRTNYGDTGGGSGASAQVPEPGTASLACGVLGLAVSGVFRRPRRAFRL